MSSLKKIQHFSLFSQTVYPIVSKQQIRSDRTIDSTSDNFQTSKKQIPIFNTQLNILLCCHQSLIFDQFQSTAQKLNFKMIQKQDNYVTVICQPKQGFFSMLNCFSFGNQNNITAIKLIINKQSLSSNNICKVKGLTGCKKTIIFFLRLFSQKIQQFQVLDSEQHFEFQDQLNQNVKTLENASNPFILQNSVIYTVYKILSNQTSQIGKFISLKLSELKSYFKNISLSAQIKELKNKPMKILMKLIYETVQIIKKSEFFITQFNINKISSYIRHGVQKYIFQKVYSQIQNYYTIKTFKTVSNFIMKRDKIFKELTLKEILSEASLDMKFVFLKSQDKEKDLKYKYSPKEMIEKMGLQIPCQQLQKVLSLNISYPRQKIQICMQMYGKLKQLIQQKSNNKVELFSMQDIIPMTIILILLSGNSNPENSKQGNLRRDLQIMSEFLNQDECDCQAQKRLIVNMIESINYVSRDWKI